VRRTGITLTVINSNFARDEIVRRIGRRHGAPVHFCAAANGTNHTLITRIGERSAQPILAEVCNALGQPINNGRCKEASLSD